MEFKLFKKLGALEGLDLIMMVVTASVFLVLLAAVLLYRRNHRNEPANRQKPGNIRMIAYGALCLTLSFVLSYFKLFSMPFGGSITLVSMLPIMFFANIAGPLYGFMTAFAYALLQIVQGAWIVHPVQFILDYFVAFLCLGIPAFFPDKLTLGAATGGFLRMMVSTVSGAIFFSDSGFDYGITNPWIYSLAYNGLSIGIDTVLCVAVSLIPAFGRLKEKIRCS